MTTRLWLPLCLLAPAITVAWGQTTTPVVTTAGPITGLQQGDLRVFKGIPFAAPPVGPLRWQAPQPPAPWREPRACTAFGPSCPQHTGEKLVPIGGPFSEDCLYLNVWTTAAPDARQPVMFWIHGGGFTMGGAAQATYDGANLARHGVVVVTINYRLGPFGFTALPALTAASGHNASGNYGLLDQIAALQWVRDNIAGFGGDPGQVTIFGESAGAVSVNLLLCSPLAQGLFHRAIAESGSLPTRLPPLRVAERRGLALAEKLGVTEGPDMLAQLRAKPADQILAATGRPSPLPGGGTVEFVCLDGYVLREKPEQTAEAGRLTRVPYLAGTVADEGSVFARRFPINSVKGYQATLHFIFGDQAAALEKLYPVEKPQDIGPALNGLLGDAFVAGTRRMVRNMAAAGSPAYLYQFTRLSDVAAAAGVGCFHGSELPYVFGNLGPVGRDARDRDLAEAVMGYWTRFAATGDPNGGGAVDWPRYEATTDQHLILDAPITTGTKLRQEQCDVRDQLTARVTFGLDP